MDGQTSASPSRAKPARVFVVDDNHAFRIAALELLAELDEIVVCGEAQDSASAMAKIAALKPHLVITDITIPGDDGLEIARLLQSVAPETSVLVMSMHDELLYGLRALKVGARGYVYKEDAAGSLASAIRQILAGEYFLSPKLLSHLIQVSTARSRPVGDANRSAIQTLTDRELEVFSWMGQGLGSVQIAKQLGLGLKTIETHRASIKKKLAARSAEDAVKMAVEWRELESLARGFESWRRN